jgi:hypothetical protein
MVSGETFLRNFKFYAKTLTKLHDLTVFGKHQVIPPFNAVDKLTVGIYAGLMEMEGEGAEGKLRRNPAQPVPDNSEESRLENQARTAYAKGQ